MAEERIDLPATPKHIALEADLTRRNSTGDLIISKREVKVLPRYLSASMSSCHDFCKYGIKHILKQKARTPIPRRITERPGGGQNQAEDVNIEERKNKSVISPKPLPNSKSQMTDKHQVIEKETPVSAKKTPDGGQDQAEDANIEEKKNKSVISPKPLPNSKSQTSDKHQVIEKETPVSAKKAAISSKRLSSPGDGIDVSAKRASDLRPKTLQSKSYSFSTPGRRLSSRRYSEIPPCKGIGGLQASPVRGSPSSRRHSDSNTSKEKRTSKLGKKNDLVPPTVSQSPRPPIKRELSTKLGHYKDPKPASHLKSQNSVRKAEPKQPLDEKVPGKTLYVVETMPENPIVYLTRNGKGATHSSKSPSLSSKDKNLECRRHGMQTSQSPSSTESKKLRHTRNSIHFTRSSSFSSPSAEKKSLRCAKTGNRNALSSSSSLSLLSSSSSASESMKSDVSDPEGNETRTENQTANHKVKRTGRPTGVGRVSSEDKISSPQKLNFMRGKVVDVQSKNTSPRRLRYKQRRVLSETQNGKADTKPRNLKKAVVKSDLSGSETKTPNVVLRHQAVEGKKSGQSLFNNVIEETASKLVQTRKSKVKALVGAFETVISLQDTKSSATTMAS